MVGGAVAASIADASQVAHVANPITEILSLRMSIPTCSVVHLCEFGFLELLLKDTMQVQWLCGLEQRYLVLASVVISNS